MAQERQRRDELGQRQRLDQYRQQQIQQQRLDSQRRQILERERRVAQLRYQQRYFDRLRQDQARLRSWSYSYAPTQYRYNRGGRYYEVNNYGADMLRQAVRYGYEEGVRAGQSDREDRWRNNYQESFAYQDATAGYNGYYVDLPEYRYYFREGFRRGYEDGYYGRTRYGSNSNGVFSLLGNVLQGILNLQNYNN
ncbi:MAG: hypothetical protein AABN34_14450 [Acidobacteriota bacterium]